ncbi:A/G-specific adenine glycosylase [Pseudodesulfovibrio mercurii]|uniref:Adenine DNA glycosylase n=1 Tax=Pseudodesulfovibrio mercurii TaxID=641491 RepID=F0JH10_9BACT|nr:A/G-specific adenine glycosylase [Pseudodesulfovibrio mercurii]EGB13949.1 A/G-specific adenine glycosylase [Pseudodesulfovibrio mercurii]
MDQTGFTRALLQWYDAEHRDLPWRRDPSPYRVWVSEIMAQQTQMDRVVEYYKRWMDRFPDIRSLADAHEEEVLNLWEGLGYYSRARNLHRAAVLIEDHFNGEFPADFSDIRSLPGVGDYTAGAVASIAFGEAEIAVDANVLRVFARLLDMDLPVRDRAGRNMVEDAVRRLIPEDRPGDFNQALMEFGALICRKNPRCEACPVRAFCRAHEMGTVPLRPVLPEAKQVIRVDMATGFLVHRGRVLIQKRRPGDVWPGLWEFPGGCIEPGETPEQALRREYLEEVELAVEPVEKITVVRYSYTRYRVTMDCFLCRYDGDPVDPVFHEAVKGGFVPPADLANYALPSGHRKLVDRMLADMRYAHLFKS